MMVVMDVVMVVLVVEMMVKGKKVVMVERDDVDGVMVEVEWVDSDIDDGDDYNIDDGHRSSCW